MKTKRINKKRNAKEDKTMIKNSFVKGAFISTLGIVITKILGILYVIPFHAVIGEKGGALYGYAYSIYLVFMSLSSAGIPLAISKIISEYHTLGYSNAKKRAFIIGRKIALLLGFICFLILILFAPILARFILGDLTGGNTIEDVTFVIRVIASAILVVPILSIYRGYFEGHRFMSPPSVSQVVEQVVRVLIIVLGSFLTLKVFNLSLTTAVGVAVFGATVGAFASYIYLVDKNKKNKDKFLEDKKANEPIITNKQIFKKIVIYAVPFIMIDIFKSLYSYVDMVTVVKGLVKHANFSVENAEIIMSMLSTWGAKFAMIILSISTGVIVSLIPNLTKSVIEENQEDVNLKINQTLSILFYLMIPMTVGISFLAKPAWIVFYGHSHYGPSVLAYFIFTGLISGMFTAAITIIQTLKDYKMVFISLFCGVVVKVLLNTKLIIAFYKMGLPAYYGVITATIIAYLLSFIICLIALKVKYKINYESSIKNFIDILFSTMLMLGGLYIVKVFLPISVSSRLMNILIIAIYSIIGGSIYLLFTYKVNIVKNVFGNKLDKFIKKRNVKN